MTVQVKRRQHIGTAGGIGRDRKTAGNILVQADSSLVINIFPFCIAGGVKLVRRQGIQSVLQAGIVLRLVGQRALSTTCNGQGSNSLRLHCGGSGESILDGFRRSLLSKSRKTDTEHYCRRSSHGQQFLCCSVHRVSSFLYIMCTAGINCMSFSLYPPPLCILQEDFDTKSYFFAFQQFVQGRRYFVAK